MELDQVQETVNQQPEVEPAETEQTLTNEALDEGQESEPVETEETDPDAEQTTEEFEEIIHNGEVKKLTKAEMKELAQKGFDATQKWQEAADQRRANESERQVLDRTWQLQTTLINDLAERAALAKQVSEYESVNWNELEAQDPSLAQAHWRQFSQLKENLNKMDQNITQVSQQKFQEMHQTAAQIEAEARKQLREYVPEWDNISKEIAQYATQQGYQPQELAPLIYDAHGIPVGINYPALDVRAMKILHKAMLYDQLQTKAKAKPRTTQEVKPTQTVSRGASGVKDPSKMTDKEFAAWRKKQIANR